MEKKQRGFLGSLIRLVGVIAILNLTALGGMFALRGKVNPQAPLGGLDNQPSVSRPGLVVEAKWDSLESLIAEAPQDELVEQTISFRDHDYGVREYTIMAPAGAVQENNEGYTAPYYIQLGDSVKLRSEFGRWDMAERKEDIQRGWKTVKQIQYLDDDLMIVEYDTEERPYEFYMTVRCGYQELSFKGEDSDDNSNTVLTLEECLLAVRCLSTLKLVEEVPTDPIAVFDAFEVEYLPEDASQPSEITFIEISEGSTALLELLPQCTSLTELNLEAKLVAADYERLSEIPSLRVLRLGNIILREDRAKAVWKLKSLEGLKVECDRRLYPGLGELTNLKRLSFESSGNNAEDFRFLENLTELEELRIACSTFDPLEKGVLQPFSGMSNLSRLSLKGYFNNEDLEVLSNLTGLTELEIDEVRFFENRPRIDDGLFTKLTGLTALESLTIKGNEYADVKPSITAEGLDQLSSLPIKTLVLKDLAIGDEIGDVLAKFPQLEQLTLHNLSITGALLTKVAEQDSLKLVQVRTNDVVTNEDIEQLKTARPDLEVKNYWSSESAFNLVNAKPPEPTTPNTGDPVTDPVVSNPPTNPPTDPAATNLSEPISAAVLARLNDPANEHEAEYLALLGHADAGTRKLAIDALLDCPLEEDEDRNKIFALVSDSDSNVRAAVAEFIAYNYDDTPAALAAVKKLLGDEDAYVRETAIECAGNFDETTDGLTSVLLKMVEEDEDDVAEIAIQQLQNRRIPSESVRVLKAAYPTHQYLALLALANAPRQDEMIPWAETLIQEEGQHSAGIMLGRWGAEAELLKIANSDDTEVRLIAIAGLLQINPITPEIEAVLRKGILDKDVDAKVEVLDAMYQRGDYSDALLTVVFHCCGDAEESVRASAIDVIEAQLYDRDARDVMKIANTAARKYPDNIGFKISRAFIGYDIAYDALTARERDVEQAHKIFNYVAKDIRDVLEKGHKLGSAERGFVGRLFYDAACASSLSEEKEEAVAHLKDALENGWTNVGLLKNDSDLDAIREMPEYKTLLEKYESN